MRDMGKRFRKSGYRCGFGLRSYDRNIAKIHRVVTAPRSYMCPKYHGGKCTDFYNGQDKR